ncbi:MAG TPA: hypothetical protein VJT74_01490 [Pyrinomonadaceae bacterium]|nr:hypothetical protein [Pyrinomonadaceae bacterium]
MKQIFQHLPFAEMADLAEGRLTPEARAASLEHVSACSRCSAKLERLEQVMGLMRSDEGEDAPAALVSQAINLFRARAARDTSPSLTRRILAALSFDSLQMSPAYGVRSGQGAARQLLYSAGENDLDLRVTPSGESWVIAGQVLGANCAGLKGAAELQGASGTTSIELNDLCEFRLPPVASGSYQLRVRLGDDLIEIPEIELKAN